MATFDASATFDLCAVDPKREVIDAKRAEELLAPLVAAAAFPSGYTRVRLSNKSLTPDAAKALAERALAALANVVELDISDVIASRPEDDALQALSAVCGAFAGRPLVEVNVSDNALGQKGIDACLPVLQEQASLERLYVCNNGLSAAAAEQLVGLLLFRDGAAAAEPGAPSAPTTLKLLHFFNNMQDDGGAIHIARVVERSPLLEDFRLSSTRCKNDGGVALGTALGKFHNLRKLEISDNSFGSVGGEASCGSAARLCRCAKTLCSCPSLSTC